MTFKEYAAKYKTTPISAKEQKVLEDFRVASDEVVERLIDEDNSDVAYALQSYTSSLQFVNTDPGLILDEKSWEDEEKKLEGFQEFLSKDDNFEQIMQAGTTGENPPFGKDGELFFQTLETMNRNFLLNIDVEAWREHYLDYLKGIDWKGKKSELEEDDLGRDSMTEGERESVNEEERESVNEEERESVTSESRDSVTSESRDSVTSENRDSVTSENQGSGQKEEVDQEKARQEQEKKEREQEEAQQQRDIERFHMNTVSEEVDAFNGAMGANLKNIDPKVLHDAGLTDARPHSNACVFSMFVMAKHGVPFKDLPKFERGELEGHDKAKYLAEFETFLKEHPVTSEDEKGKVTYYPENAKAWGELYRDADKVLSEYRLPDINLGDPKEWEKAKDDIVLLEKIGTDFVQVIQDHQMKKFRAPELAEGYMRGFGSEEAQSHFWANVVTTQNLKGLMQGLGVAQQGRKLDQMAIKNAELRWIFDQNQDLYRGKTLDEFRQNMPYQMTLNTNGLVAAPLGAGQLRRMSPQDRKAIEDYLENGTPLPKKLEDRVKGDFEFLKTTMYEAMATGEVAGGIRVEASQNNLNEMINDITGTANSERIPEVWQMTEQQRKKADLDFHRIYFPTYNLYGISSNLTDSGHTVYDCIKINGKPLREHCEAKYNEDPIFGEDRKWTELSEEERRQYMRMETTRATLDKADQVTCHEIVMGKDGKLVISEKSVAAGRFDPEAQRRKNQLPEFMELSDDILKASYYNPNAYVDGIITSLPSQKAISEEINRPPYSELDERTEGSLATGLYVKEGEDAPEVITDYAQVGGSSARHIMKVQDPKVLKQYRDVLRQNGDRCDEISANRLNSKEEQLKYGNDLMQQVDIEYQKVEKAKQAKEEYLKSEEGELARMQMVRAKEALEKVQKKHDELEGRVQKLTEELKDLPDAEAPLEYNPFSAGGNKAQKERALSIDKEELEKAKKELAEAQEDVRKAQERQDKFIKGAEIYDKQIENFQKRYESRKKQIKQDVSEEGYEKIKTKTRDMLKAVGPNRIRRAADGYSAEYVLTKTPFLHGAQAFGPVLDLSYEKSITAKVALCSRNDFPLYDAVIAEDATEQTLVDYWKEKENAKTPMNPQKEEQYRRRLYDQVSQLDGYLSEIYKTLDDPEKNQQLWDMQISDTGNEPWHMHEKAARGSLGMKTAAEAYKTGLEQNWHIDDLGTLANFNHIRRNERGKTLHNQVTSQKDLVEFEKPVYQDPKHEKWLDDMDKLWEKIQTTPVKSAEQRKELLEEMHEKIREGFSKGYVQDVDAKGFNQTYTTCRKRDLLIERGLEPAFVETKGLTMSDKGKERLNEVKEYREQDFKLGSDEAFGREPKREEPEREAQSDEPSFMAEEELNTSFYEERDDSRDFENVEDTKSAENEGPERESSKAQKGGETAQVDWEFEKNYEKFNAKRSKIFLGRESDTHEKLRTATEKMRDIRAKIGYPMKTEKLPEYLNVLDEVAYRSAQYQKEHPDPKTPAGKERLEGAVDFEKMAKEELLRVKNALNKSLGTDYDLNKLRTMVAKVQAAKAEEKIGELMNGGKPLTDKAKEQIQDRAATIMAATVANSSVEASRNGFQTMGMNAVKKSILGNKEFKSVMQDYFKKPGMTAEKMIGDLKNGKAIQKMTKLRKDLDINEKDIQKLAEASKKKEEPKKESPKKTTSLG